MATSICTKRGYRLHGAGLATGLGEKTSPEESRV